MRMTELAEPVVLSRTGVSRIVGRMADAGMVEQDPDPQDLRATFATLTPKGRDALRKAAPHLSGRHRHCVFGLPHLGSGPIPSSLPSAKVLEPER